MFQKILFLFQIFYFAQNILYTCQMNCEQYIILFFFITLVNCRVFDYKFNLVRPLRGILMLFIACIIGAILFFKRQRFLFLEVSKSDFIWMMHSFMFYSIFYLIFFVLAIVIAILIFVFLSMGISYILKKYFLLKFFCLQQSNH